MSTRSTRITRSTRGSKNKDDNADEIPNPQKAVLRAIRAICDPDCTDFGVEQERDQSGYLFFSNCKSFEYEYVSRLKLKQITN